MRSFGTASNPAWLGGWVLGIGILLEILGLMILVFRWLWYYERNTQKRKNCRKQFLESCGVLLLMKIPARTL